MWVAKTSSCSSKMLVTFYWKAKYSSPTLLFLRVDFIMLTSSLIFFLSTWSTFACTSYSITSYMCSSLYFSEFILLLFKPRFSYILLLIKGKLGCFFVDPDRLFYNFYFYFLTYSLFFWLTPELLGIGGGGGSVFLSGTTLLFWIGFSFSSFLICFNDSIFWICYFENSFWTSIASLFF